MAKRTIKKAKAASPAVPLRSSLTGSQTLEKPVVPRKRKNKNARKPLQSHSFGRFIHRVLKEVHPELRISKQAMSIVNSFVIDTFERLAKEASSINRRSKTKTLSSRDIQFAVKLLIPGELGEHAMAEGTKAVLKCTKAASEKE